MREITMTQAAARQRCNLHLGERVTHFARSVVRPFARSVVYSWLYGLFLKFFLLMAFSRSRNYFRVVIGQAGCLAGYHHRHALDKDSKNCLSDVD